MYVILITRVVNSEPTCAEMSSLTQLSTGLALMALRSCVT